MRTIITRVVGSGLARIKNPAPCVIPPSAVLQIMRGAADLSGNSAVHGTRFSRSDFADSVNGITSPVAEGAWDFQNFGASKPAYTGELEMLWNVVRVLVEDLSLAGRQVIPVESINDIRDARETVAEWEALTEKQRDNVGEKGPLYFCDAVGLNPAYFVRKLREFGYLPEIKTRKVNRARSIRWGLPAALENIQNGTDVAKARRRFRSTYQLEQLAQTNQQARI
jgi:hypothetical protein